MNRLKELRKGRYTQNEMAALLDVGRTTYTKYESGDIVLNADVLIRLSQIFSVSIDFIVGNDSVAAAPPVSEADAETLDAISELNETGKKLLSDYLEMLLSKPEYRKKERTALAK